MAGKDTTGSTASKAGTRPFSPNWGQERTEAVIGLQKSILESCEHASRAWLDRMQAEVSLWSDLANKLNGTHSIPEAMDTYTKCVSKRMQMAAEDGRRMVEEAQQITQKVAHSLGTEWPAVRST